MDPNTSNADKIRTRLSSDREMEDGNSENVRQLTVDTLVVTNQPAIVSANISVKMQNSQSDYTNPLSVTPPLQLQSTNIKDSQPNLNAIDNVISSTNQKNNNNEKLIESHTTNKQNQMKKVLSDFHQNTNVNRNPNDSGDSTKSVDLKSDQQSYKQPKANVTDIAIAQRKPSGTDLIFRTNSISANKNQNGTSDDTDKNNNQQNRRWSLPDLMLQSRLGRRISDYLKRKTDGSGRFSSFVRGAKFSVTMEHSAHELSKMQIPPLSRIISQQTMSELLWEKYFLVNKKKWEQILEDHTMKAIAGKDLTKKSCNVNQNFGNVSNDKLIEFTNLNVENPQLKVQIRNAPLCAGHNFFHFLMLYFEG